MVTAVSLVSLPAITKPTSNIVLYVLLSELIIDDKFALMPVFNERISELFEIIS